MRKFFVPVVIYSALATVAAGFSATSLLDTVMESKDSSYAAISLYLITWSSGQSLVTLGILALIVMELNWFYGQNSVKTYSSLYFLITMVCTIFIIRAAIIGCPIMLELIISLLGLIIFGFLLMLYMWSLTERQGFEKAFWTSIASSHFIKI